MQPCNYDNYEQCGQAQHCSILLYYRLIIFSCVINFLVSNIAFYLKVSLLNASFILFNGQQRSISSLDQQSTHFTAPSGGGDDDDKRSGNMAPPVFAAPKLKPSNDKKESTNSSDAFKMPLMPLSSVLSGTKILSRSTSQIMNVYYIPVVKLTK